MTRSFWICLAVVCSSVVLLAQPNPQTRWTRPILGDSIDAVTSLVQAPNGTYLIAGYTSSWGAGGWDIYVASLDSLGIMQWHRTYGGAHHDAAMAIRSVDATHYVVAGYTQALDAGPLNVYVMKINEDGVQQWYRSYFSASEEYANDIQRTADGGFILTGSTEGGGNFDMYLRKINSSGEPQWTHNVNHNNEVGYSVQQTADSGYVVVGYTTNFQQDGYLVKTNSNGVKTWDRYIGGAGDETFRVVRQTADHGYIIAGKSTSSGGYDRPYLVKTDSTGDTRWTHVYGQSLHSGCFYALDILAGGDYIAAGGLNDHFYIARIDTNGVVRWEREYTYMFSTVVLAAYSMQPTHDGCYVLGGYVASPETNTWDMYVLKTGHDAMNVSAVDPHSVVIPAGYALSVYPNPFNATASLEFTLPQAAHARIEIHDLQGRQVLTAANEDFSPGEHRLTFDGSTLPSGIYFARLTTPGYAVTQKMMLLK